MNDDIILDSSGDIYITENGDIKVESSVRQRILIRLRWIFKEWRLGERYGFPYFEEVLVKNPNTTKIKQLFRNEIMKVEKVADVEIQNVRYNVKSRRLTLKFRAITDQETFMEEIELYA